MFLGRKFGVVGFQPITQRGVPPGEFQVLVGMRMWETTRMMMGPLWGTSVLPATGALISCVGLGLKSPAAPSQFAAAMRCDREEVCG